MPDVIAVRVQVFFANIAVALPLARDGKVRALAVPLLTRAPAAPELPTMNDAGLPGFESLAWFGILAPAGTPPAEVQRLQAGVQKALATPAVKEPAGGDGRAARRHDVSGLHPGEPGRHQALGAEAGCCRRPATLLARGAPCCCR